MRRLIVIAVARSRRSAGLVLLAFAVLVALSLLAASMHLGIDTNTDDLFARSLPWRQHQIEFRKEFPQFSDLLVAVVKADTPEAADATAKALAKKVAADKAHFKSVSRPGTGPFYAHEGLLLMPVNKLSGLLNSIVSAQPFLGQLSHDPSAAGLFRALQLMAQGVVAGQANLQPYHGELTTFARALHAAASGHPRPISWQSLITPGLAKQQGVTRFLLVHPVLNHGALEPGGAATHALEKLIATLPDVKAGNASVHYTGQIPLADEQFASLKQGMVFGLAISIALITIWLLLAVRTWRMIVPILVTLLGGLALTIGFATVAIGRLNLISVAFAILFVGLAVDFAIQFCVRLRDVRHRIDDPALALFGAAREAGGQIALAAIATACGFLAFVPTAFVGVAELGLIAGAGMIIAFVCTVTLLPALLAKTRPAREPQRIGFRLGDLADAALRRHHRPVLVIFALAGMAGIASIAMIHFDANPLHTQNPNSEAMRTLRSLSTNPITNPFYIDVLARNLKRAQHLAGAFGKLPEVSQVISGATFIPEKQSEKLAMIQQTQQILAPTLATDGTPTTAPAKLRAAAHSAAHEIAKAAPKLPKNSPLRSIGQSLKTLAQAPDSEITAASKALTKYLPGELTRLNDALSAKRITKANLPHSIKRDWFLPDGRVRVQVIPTKAAEQSSGLRRFVDAVQNIAPDAAGPAVTTVATAHTILGSFREAAGLAAVAIAAILVLVLRSARDGALVVSTLAVSAFLTALAANLAGLSLNYANIIALPLLLGVGVSFNVYFVMNWRSGMKNLLGSATARAVLFSALTTGTAFGSLAASHDRGTASMGYLLLLSLAAVLVATFIFLPALLYALPRRE